MAAMLAPEHDFQQIRICPKTELALHPQTGEFANRPTRPLHLRGHCAFVGVGQAQNRGLIEVSTKNLQANGKLLAGLAARN